MRSHWKSEDGCQDCGDGSWVLGARKVLFHVKQRFEGVRVAYW